MNTITKAFDSAKANYSEKKITVRKNMDFSQNDIPKYWFAGSPFKTRVADALQMTFPVGERYFIESVRAYRDDITDEQLKAEVKDFIMQEAQHGISHEQINDLLRAQGMPINRMEKTLKNILNSHTKELSREFNIAHTAATEHLTALMAKAFFHYRSTMEGVDPNMRGLLAWHAVEEMEHRAVAFDVMKHASDTKEIQRYTAMALVSTLMPIFTLTRAVIMLRVDGFSVLQIARMMVSKDGLPWLFAKGGILRGVATEYADWYRRDFHPNMHPMVHNYQDWVAVYEKTGDPIEAGNAMWAAGY